MLTPKFVIPQDWFDSLVELRERARLLPEDVEDLWARKGLARYEAITSEEKVRVDQENIEILDRFQQPGVNAAIDRVLGRSRLTKTQ